MKKQLPIWCSNRGAACLRMTLIPSYFGIGNLGKHAYEFLGLSGTSGFSSWQTCPVVRPVMVILPIRSFSSSPVNSYLIDWNR